MPLSAIALVTVAQARAALGLVDASRDPHVETVINYASSLAERYCKRPLKARAFTNVRLAGPCSARLYPVGLSTGDLDAATGGEGLLGIPIDRTGTITVSVNEAVQTVWKSEADGAPDSKNVQVYVDHFYRAGGWAPIGLTERNVLLTYTGGYAVVPDDLQEAALELIQKLWGPVIDGRPDIASFAGPGGSVQTLEGQWAGGTNPWALTRRAQDVFYFYRVHRL